MNKFACESRLDKPFPPNVYNTLSLKKEGWKKTIHPHLSNNLKSG